MSHDDVRRDRRERALLRRCRDRRDPIAREEMVALAMPLVRSLARRYARSGEPFDDLVQVGAIGLLKAIDRFDPDAGTRFVSFAAPTITGEIRRHFRDHTWAVHVPRGLQELDARLQRARTRLEAAGGPPPTVADLAAEVQASPTAVREALAAAQAYRTHSIDGPGGAGGELLASHGQVDPGYADVVDRDTVRHAGVAVDARARRVLEMRFGEDRLQRDIAEEIGVSQMQVSRIISSSLARMRTQLDGRAPEAA